MFFAGPGTAVNHFVNRSFSEMIHGCTPAVSRAGGRQLRGTCAWQNSGVAEQRMNNLNADDLQYIRWTGGSRTTAASPSTPRSPKFPSPARVVTVATVVEIGPEVPVSCYLFFIFLHSKKQNTLDVAGLPG